jgi:iron complex outermembrane recepter protein
MSKQGLRGVEIETLDQLFGAAGIVGSFTVHDLTVGYEWSDSIDIYGGINNVGDRTAVQHRAGLSGEPDRPELLPRRHGALLTA